jgi:hypothetical protein
MFCYDRDHMCWRISAPPVLLGSLPDLLGALVEAVNDERDSPLHSAKDVLITEAGIRGPR